MSGHKLGSFKTTVILSEDGSERAGGFDGDITIVFVLDIPPASNAYIYQIWIQVERECASEDDSQNV